MPLTPDAEALIAAARLDLDDEGLSAFPSERDEKGLSTMAASPRRPHGVTMRVAPISAGTAWLLAAILLLGAGSAAAIGLFAGGATLSTASTSQARP